MANLKTRFVIAASGQLSELFSVKERKNGDLLVLLKRPKQVELGHDAQYDDINEQRLSVHVSPKSPAHTVIFHTVFADARHLTTAAVVRPRNGRFLWPLLATISQDLSLPHYESKPDERDQVISLGEYNPRLAQLTYHLAVSSPRTSPPFIRHANRRTVNFGKFALHIWWSFIPSLSIPQGSTILFCTSQPQIDDQPGQGPRIENAVSFKNQDLINRFRVTDRELSESMLFKQKRLFGGLLLPKADEEILRAMIHVRQKSPLP